MFFFNIPVFSVVLNLFLEVCGTSLYVVLSLRASTVPLGQMETMATKASWCKSNLLGICIHGSKKNIHHLSDYAPSGTAINETFPCLHLEMGLMHIHEFVLNLVLMLVNYLE